jgi:hypothetical protein
MSSDSLLENVLCSVSTSCYSIKEEEAVSLVDKSIGVALIDERHVSNQKSILCNPLHAIGCPTQESIKTLPAV